jgi:hypothetical protein
MNRVTVDRHAAWRMRLAQQEAFLTAPVEIDGLLSDEDFDDLLEIDPFVSGTNNRRSDKELARVLELIDNLPISDAGKDGHE